MRLKDYLYNLLNDRTGPFAGVDGDARKLLKELIHCRNPDTGKCYPSWDHQGHAVGDCVRNVGYMLGRLDAGPSRQSDGRIVEGHGLIWRYRPRGGFERLPTQYGLTCKFLILAGVLLPHNCMACSCGTAWGAEERGSISSGSSPLLLPSGSSQNEGKQRKQSRAPFVKSSPPAAPENDPTVAAFLAEFEWQRLRRYGDNEHGSLIAENRDKLSAYLIDLVGGAWAWSTQEGHGIERAEVARGVFERLVRFWLDWPGKTGFLRERRHPIGLLIGDLELFGKRARAAWKRAQRLLPPPEAPAGFVSVAAAAALATAEEEAWPEFDAAELVALAMHEPQEPDRCVAVEPAEEDLPTTDEDPATDRSEIAEVGRKLAAPEKSAVYIAQARTASAALLPSARLAPGAPAVFADNDTGAERDVCLREGEEGDAPGSQFARVATDQFARLDKTAARLRAMLADALPSSAGSQAPGEVGPLRPLAPVVKLFSLPAYQCKCVLEEDDSEYGLAHNDTDDDWEFFPRELERARHERAVLAAVKRDLVLAPTLRPEVLSVDAGQPRLRGLHLAGKLEQRGDGIGDHDAGRANGAEDSIEHEVGARDDAPPRFGGGGGTGDGGIEGGQTGHGEADRDVLVGDGAAIGLSGASHETRVPRESGAQTGGPVGVSRNDRAQASAAGDDVTRQTEPPCPASGLSESDEMSENAADWAWFGVSHDDVAEPVTAGDDVTRQNGPPVSTSGLDGVLAMSENAAEIVWFGVSHDDVAEPFAPGDGVTRQPAPLDRPTPRYLRQLRQPRDAEQRGGPLGAPIIALGRGHLGVPGELGLDERSPADVPEEDLGGAEPRQRLERPLGAVDEGSRTQSGDLEREEFGAAERASPAEQQEPSAHVAGLVSAPLDESAVIVREEGLDAT